MSYCKLYDKHHNCIDGIYMERNAKSWEDIPLIDPIDADNENGELLSMLNDLTFYDIQNLKNFKNPYDNHGIKESIFILIRDGRYYLCETQGEGHIKFSCEITHIDYIRDYDRRMKLNKLSNNQRF